MPERAGPPVPPWVDVDDPAQAEVLVDPERLRFLRPFVGRSRTVTQAATEVGCSPDVMLYRVRTLLRVGLLRVDHEVPRRGRAIKHYRSSADGYFVPFALTPHATLEELLARTYGDELEPLVAGAARALRAAGVEGRRLTRQGEGVFTEAAARFDTPLVYDHPELRNKLLGTRRVRMTRAQAEALQRDLLELLDRHVADPDAGPPDEGARAYILWGASMPLDEPW